MGNRYAIIVGSNAYKGEHRLSFSLKDANDVYKALIDRCLFKSAQMKLLLFEDINDKNLINSIGNAFLEIIDLGFKEGEDALLFYFSGHGVWDKDENRSMLELSDSEKISMQTIYDNIQNLSPKVSYMFIDACHSGGEINLNSGCKSIDGKSYRSLTFKANGFHALFASSIRQKAVEPNESQSLKQQINNSYFTHHLLAVFNDLTKYVDGILPFDIIKGYVETKVALMSNLVQIPCSIENKVDGTPPYPLGFYKNFETTTTFDTKDKSIAIITEDYDWEISDAFISEIEDLGMSYTHPRVTSLSLSDIFITRTLRCFSSSKSDSLKFWDSDDVFAFKDGMRLFIKGEESSGKTALCRNYFKELHNQGYIPVYINCENIKKPKKTHIQKILKEAIELQYVLASISPLSQKSKLILILDDFNKIGIKRKEEKALFIKHINEEYNNIIILGDNISYQEIVVSNYKFSNVFEQYEEFVLLHLGTGKRRQLLEKWQSIKRDEFLEENEYLRKCDEIERNIKVIIGKNLIPAFPFYILSLIQMLETKRETKTEYSLHGYYYETLINVALSRVVKETEEIGFYHNYMMYLMKEMYSTHTKLMDKDSFEIFHDKFIKRFLITDSSHEKILTTLKEARLIKMVNHKLRASERFVYYFFVAKYYAQHHNNNAEDREEIKKMCQRLDIDEYGGIIMFLTHISKDNIIIELIIENAVNQFDEVVPLTLKDDIEIINSLIDDMPQLVLDNISHRDNRQELIQEIEKIERDEEESTIDDDDDGDLDNSNNESDEEIVMSFISRVTRSFKTIEILGQIAKKYWGELEGSQKIKLTNETYNLGLRVLSYWIKQIQENKEALINYLTDIITNNVKLNSNKEVDRILVQKHVQKIIFNLSEMTILSIIKRISNSIGYHKLFEVFKSVKETSDSYSINLIDLSIKLDFGKSLPFKDIEENHDEFKGNYICYKLLQDLVINYVYMFDTTERERQQISNLFKIENKKLLIINSSSKLKK